MAKRLLLLKNFVKDLASPDVHLTEQEWEKLEQLVSILEIPYKTTG